ncbi:MAG: cysteine--1-D-myo-inosityl 2-amino-2-deoxy-alpha-D-glucopyranoside ligase [Streptosporangiaceae bacterium]|jgi:L-cysteine:1D-myo-inositol 2-amino-2-deoxy-alpha-D-glucopyranoside ligase
MESWRSATVPELPGRAPSPRITDTASGELAVAAAGRAATLYACGITPYDATHIGHAATFIAWDLLVRAWRDAGHDVTYVQNVTDVDDPLLERADRDGEDWRELGSREIELYRGDMAALRVLAPDSFVGAVEAMGLIRRFNLALAGHGALYELGGDTYFARSSDPAFGTVSGLDPAAMAVLSAERGGDPGRPGKKDPLDAVVWLAARPGEPSWESELGAGRPGWHVECAAIATEYLGAVFDIQAGGSDLVYPHHEMSASHARVAGGGGPMFARRYAHAGMVRLDGEKMSKSLGNLVFVSVLRSAGVDPMAIRLAILAHHYRQDWDWTAAGLADAERRLDRWRRAVALGAGGSPAPDLGSGAGLGSERAPGSDLAPGPGLGLAPGPRLAPGRAVASGSGGGQARRPRGRAAEADAAAAAVLAAVRERMADDLDAPGALAVVDRWADAVLAGSPPPAAWLVADTVDALLGVAL